MRFTGARLTLELLKRQGIGVVAGIPGGATLPLYDALGSSDIRHVLVRHEQAAGFIAQGIARSTGRAAVCLATSGPGAVNLLTAVADAKLDSIPIVAITGQVATPLIGTDAFQEVDTYGMSIPITKHNFLVRSARELADVIPAAFRIALSGRRGPVLVDIPKDVQQAEVEIDRLPEPGAPDPAPEADGALLAHMARMIAAAERPVIYAGGGVVASGAEEEVRAISAASDIPIACTLMALGVARPGDPLTLGMLGMHGGLAVNHAVDRADLLIVLGARFDDRATGAIATFAPRAKVIHIDIDEAEIGKIRAPDVAATCDLKRALRRLERLVGRCTRPQWRAEIEALRAKHPPLASADPSHPANLVRAIAGIMPRETIVATDVGQHQMWAAQEWPVSDPRRFLTSGGLGTMGFGVPAAMGARLAHPDATPVIALSGDGSFLMNIQELDTIAEQGLEVKICVFNNRHLGLVRQQQELFYQKRYVASRFTTRPDFAAIARGFGIPGHTIPLPHDHDALAAALRAPGPALIDIEISGAENVLPMVPPGKGNTESPWA